MKIDKETLICGIPIIKIREFMRRYRTPGSFSLQTITEYFELTAPSGTSLLNELLSLGYAECVNTDKYEVTVKGNALAQVKFVKRIDKAKADKIFNGFMKRVAEINEDESYIYSVSKLCLFGSYLNPEAEDYGDIDIACELEHKISDDKRFSEASQRIIANAIADGKVFSSVLDEVCYPEDLVLRHLKNRSPYISLHRMKDIETLSAPHKQIYPDVKIEMI